MNALQPDLGADQRAADIGRQLQGYLRGKGVEEPRVSNLRRLTGGSSHDTWALDLRDGGAGAGPATKWVMRRNFASSSLDLPPEAEFRLLSWLSAVGMPVARPWLCAIEDSPFEVPFVLSQRIEGVDLCKAMAEPRSSIAADAVALDLVKLQARVHALDSVSCPAGIFRQHDHSLRYEVERWTDDLLQSRQSKLGPLPRLAVQWLRENIPSVEKPCLVHGDFKANNILWRADGTPVLLDWELAHMGDPIEDIAWTLLWRSKYDLVGGMLTAAEYVAAYEAASGLPVDRRRLLFWQLFGFVKLTAILLSGSGAISKDEGLSPSQMLLSRAVPCLEAGMASHLQALQMLQAAPGRKVMA